MMKFNAQAFYNVTRALQHLQSTLEATGKDKHAQTEGGGVTIEFIEEPILLNVLRKQARELQSSLLTLGVPQTSKSAHRLIEMVSGKQITFPQVVSMTREIASRLSDELSDVVLLSLTPKERDQYEPPEPLFGKDFETKFTSALFELDEAAKCLGLGCYTATAFHLMRLVEVGLNAVAACIGATLPASGAARNWGAVLKAIKSEMDSRNTAKTWKGDDREFFESVYASLDAVRVAWRNTTMHVENKFTEDEAEHLFVAVKGFMKKLSDRMDEKGDPKA